MVVEENNQVIATCHLTIMPSLTFTGQRRMQIEAVRVLEKLRGHKIGEWMIPWDQPSHRFERLRMNA